MQQITRSKLIPHLITALIALLIISPILLNLAFIHKYGVNCVFWDQWEMVPLFDKLYSGTLSFTDLIAQHNEHRILLPRLAMLGLGSLTHYNTIAEMYFAWLLQCIICFILFKLFTRTFGFSRMTLAKFIPVVWLVFSLRQYENLLWGFQISYFMVVLFFILAVYLLAESKKLDWRFGLAILCGLASIFSLAGGLLVWPIGLIQILFTGRTKSKRLWGLDIVKTATWAMAGILAFALYFAGYVHPEHTTNQLYSIQHPDIAGVFGLVAIGNPLSDDLFTAVLLGLLILVLYAIAGVYLLCKPRTWPLKFPFLCLVVFSVSTVALLTVARSEWGEAAAFVSRYTTTTAIGIIGLYGLALSIDMPKLKYTHFIWGAMVALLMVNVTATDIYAYFDKGREFWTDRKAAAFYLSTYSDQSDENLKNLYPLPQIVRERAQTLIKYKLNVFSQPLSITPGFALLDAEPLFYIEDVNGKRPTSQKLLPVALDGEETLTIKGWAVDQINNKVAGGMMIDIDNGRLEVPALYGVDRPDIAEYYKNENYRFSGFKASVDASAVGPGQHIISIKVLAANGEEYYQPVKILTLDIK